MTFLINPLQPNILLDEFGNARITDFGLTQDTFDVVSIPERRSVQWTAPEVLEETGTPSTETDIFSFGMVIAEVRCGSTTVRLSQVDDLFTLPRHKAFTGMAPFSDHHPLAAMIAIMSGRRPQRPAHPSFTDSLWKLLQKCWDQDRRNRPRMSEVLFALGPLTHERTPYSGSLLATAGVQTLVSDIQRLVNFDPSNEEYRSLLYALLSHQGLKQHIANLGKGDLQGFVGLLDEVSKANIYTHHY